MLIFLAILLLFAVYLFWASTDVPMTESRVVALYACVAFITLLFQIYVRSFECEGLSGCALSFSKAIVWSAIDRALATSTEARRLSDHPTPGISPKPGALARSFTVLL